MYNITTGNWTKLPDLVQARSDLGVASVTANGILAVGGFAGWQYDASGDHTYWVRSKERRERGEREKKNNLRYQTTATGDYIGTFPSGGCPANTYGDDCTCAYTQVTQIGMICLYGTW